MKKVLFVCIGNIYRSPAAEAVFSYFVNEEGLEKEYEIDSAGIMGYHSGERADRRMIEHAIVFFHVIMKKKFLIHITEG